jgi:RNA polymerase sigma-70 factor (family 1)
MIVNHATDSELVHRLTQHDAIAFEELFRRYYRYLYSVAIQYLKDPALAEDALQEVYLKLWTHREELDPTQSIKAYLAVTMRHQVLNMIRHEKRAILHHIEHQQAYSDSDSTTEDTLALNDYTAVFKEALRQLPAQRRLVFQLRAEKGLTNDEVAAQLQISVNTVKVHYYHASRFLRDYLKTQGGIEALILLLIATAGINP